MPLTQHKLASTKQTLDFVLKDIARVSRLAATATPEELGNEIGFSSGLEGEKGRYKWSIEAQRRFRQLTESLISEIPTLSGRIGLSKFHDALELALARRCIESDEKLTPSVVSEIVDFATEVAGKTLQNCIYNFPVHTVYADNLNEYKVGPVTFVRINRYFDTNRKKWTRARLENLRSYVDALDKVGRHIDFTTWRDNFEDAENHFRQHRWLASIPINGADDKKGDEKARDALELSCTLLRLRVPRCENSFIGMASDSLTRVREWHVTEIEDKGMQVGGWFRLVDLPATEQFFDWMKNPHGGWEISANLVIKYTNWERLNPAEDRLLAALRWFGEAWKESIAASRLVKFCICLEGLLSTGGKEALSEILAERLAILCFDATEDIRDAYDLTKRVYTARSKTVHGDLETPAEAENLAKMAEYLARNALLSFAVLVPDFPSKPCEFRSALKEFFVTVKLVSLAQAKSDLKSKLSMAVKETKA